jgi:hypothetical protein
VIPALHTEGKLWIAYPKTTSKIASDLNRDCSWNDLTDSGFEDVEQVTLDHVWSAIRFKKGAVVLPPVAVKVQPETKAVEIKGVGFDKNLIVPPAELEKAFNRHKKAREFFQNLSFTNQKEYVTWIEGAKREETRMRRLEATVEKLLAGKKNPTEK